MAKKTINKKTSSGININTPTLLNLYKNKILPLMMKQHNYSNIMEVPKLLSISLNIGVGDAKTNSKSFESARRGARRADVGREDFEMFE